MRRLPALVLTITALVALVVVGRTTSDAEQATFAAALEAWMPSVSVGAGASNWYCPGVPASGDGRGGEVVIANTTGTELRGRYSVLTGEGEQATETVTIAGNQRTEIDIGRAVDAPYASVVVELHRGGAVVEQRAIDPDGDTVTACSTATSARWYVADGYTVAGSSDELLLTNPSEGDAVASLTLFTAEGSRSPAEYQGFPVPARSVLVVDVAELGVQSEQIVGTSVTTTRGQLVLGRAQHFAGAERGGFTTTLGAAAPAGQWWFVVGERADGVVEEYRVLNPTDSDVEVTAAVLGVPPTGEFQGFTTFEAPAGEVTTFAAAEIEGLPDGRHALVFSTVETPGVVVERIITTTGDRGPATTVSLGALTRPDGFVANNWYVGTAPQEPTADALVIYNAVNADADVEVRALSAAGFVRILGLQRINVPAGGVVTVDLDRERVLGRTLLVSSNRQIFVERQIPRDGPLGGVTTAWPLPFDA